MTTLEAYEMVIGKIKELEKEGIEVVVVPHNSRRNAGIRAKYKGSDRIPPDKWVNVNFRPSNQEQMKKIMQAKTNFCLGGISFDSGGGCGGIDWELDFSFHFVWNLKPQMN